MSLMPPERLERLRFHAERTLTALCTLEEATTASDGAGGRTVAYGAPSAPIPAALALPTARELAEVAERYGVAASAIVRVPHDTAPPELSRLTLEGRTYTVVGSLTRAGTWQVLERLAVTEP